MLFSRKSHGVETETVKKKKETEGPSFSNSHNTGEFCCSEAGHWTSLMSGDYQDLGRRENSHWPETVEHDEEGWLMQWLWVMDG